MADQKPTVFASADWLAVLNRDDSTVYISDQKSLLPTLGRPGFVVVPLSVLEAVIARAGEYA